jgi:hypothetical protein
MQMAYWRKRILSETLDKAERGNNSAYPPPDNGNGATDMLRLKIADVFDSATKAKDRSQGEVDLWVHTLPDLMTPTGRIVACDPFYCADTSTFTVEAPAGQYPVMLSMAHFSRTGDERITAAMLRIADAPAIRWELAVCERDRNDESEMDDNEQEPLEVYTYCVDSGFASFMDVAAIDVILDRVEEVNAENDDDFYEDAGDYLQRRLEALHPMGGAEWFNIPLDDPHGTNILIFTSGWGDGAYWSYWGFGGQGSPVCLITDFGVLDEADLIE